MSGLIQFAILTDEETTVLYLFPMKKQSSSSETREEGFEEKIRYFQLIVDRFETENRLWHEYPDEMSQSTMKLAEKMLKVGLIKCKHEQQLQRK